MALITLKGVTKRFGEVTALDDVNLSIEDGEYVCVLGPTGAGKTTLLRIVAGLLAPDAGEIAIAGQRVNDQPPEARDTMYMFQQYALFPHMTVWQNVAYGPEIKEWDQKKVEQLTAEILEMVRLAERRDAYPPELSGGMQQRVALGRGIASGARILLLDEPLGALDARLRVGLRTQLRRLVKDQGLTAVHVTHDQEEALMTADRVVVLRNGRIEQTGTPHDVYSRPHSIFVASFVGGANFLEGTVLQGSDAGAVIEVLDGLQIHVAACDVGVGDRAVVAFRLEDMDVRDAAVAGANNLPGVIEAATFIGGSMEYEIRLDTGGSLMSRVLMSNAFKAYPAGQRVVVACPPETGYVFPYPVGGLRKEVEAI
jgi:ABC-type Fe3+/spermidine/putrescine transport system ATPase subunit